MVKQTTSWLTAQAARRESNTPQLGIYALYSPAFDGVWEGPDLPPLVGPEDPGYDTQGFLRWEASRVRGGG